MSIVGGGYSVRGDIQTSQSNLAFFPLFPYTVRWLAYLIPIRLRTPGAVLFVGVVVSNLLLRGALVMLRELVATSFLDRAAARRTVLYLLVFPTSFFLSCFYTESAFLFLSVAVFYAASRQAWLRAGIVAALVTLTRPLGVAIVIPLGLMYLESHEWRVRGIRWEVASLLLAPAVLLAFLLSIRPLTGQLLAPFSAHAAWGRSFAMPWQALLNPISTHAYVSTIERVLTIGMLLAAIASVALSPKGLGAYALLLTVTPLFTGTLSSNARFAVVVFLAFIVMALVGRWRVLDRILTVSLLVIQVLFFAAWSQFYWIA